MDIQLFKATPAKLIGMSKKDALALLQQNEFPFGISHEDGKLSAVPADVRILLNIEKGIVVGSHLDGKRFGKW